jgi:hypothetical protein
MSYLLAIDEKRGLILRPACLKLCPALSGLTDKEAVVIALVYDDQSTLRRFHEEDRIRRAILQVYSNNNPELLKELENPSPHSRITNAVEAYKSLQYNPKEELKKTFQKKIDSLQDLLEQETGPTGIKNILASILELRKNIQALDNEIAEDIIAEGRIEGDKELSFLEKLEENPKLYFEVVNRKPIKKS